MVKIGPTGVIRLPDGRIMKLRDAAELGLLTWSRVENFHATPRGKPYTAYFANWGNTKSSWEISRQDFLKMTKKYR